ncbi:hypothetical protein HMPREF9104_02379 [Lentilactobacillus kisonensis F0435]|uniref:Uncharacterized protein n=1 Tax=Lentilactobacillus kisonensis F0435 TaxID=797516 RepID=H1LID8_9LACO|nr:hypothetical protein HMPREF9104_02379 [Lentilactobacillus kisonensis F0435]
MKPKSLDPYKFKPYFKFGFLLEVLTRRFLLCGAVQLYES